MSETADPKPKGSRWHERGWFRAVELVGILAALGAIGFEVHH